MPRHVQRHRREYTAHLRRLQYPGHPGCLGIIPRVEPANPRSTRIAKSRSSPLMSVAAHTHAVHSCPAQSLPFSVLPQLNTGIRAPERQCLFACFQSPVRRLIPLSQDEPVRAQTPVFDFEHGKPRRPAEMKSMNVFSSRSFILLVAEPPGLAGTLHVRCLHGHVGQAQGQLHLYQCPRSCGSIDKGVAETPALLSR